MSFAHAVLGWNRGTLRKGLLELEQGVAATDDYANCGRPRSESKLPDLVADIHALVQPRSQVDPTFRSTRLYTPLTARAIRARLSSLGKYQAGQVPGRRTLSSLINRLGYQLRKVRKCKPQKKIRQTDAIFEEVHRLNRQADEDEHSLRVSIDTKAVVKLGEFSRGGKSRTDPKACDHDMGTVGKLTPFGIFLPASGENFMYFSDNKVTADCMADCLEQLWPRLKAKNPQLNRLVINADNGPESGGRRTQWLWRLVQFSQAQNIEIQLVYYPPYHSKYNPVERVWGILENQWNGELLNTAPKAPGLARTMTYRGLSPTVKLVRKIYHKGVSQTKEAMKQIQNNLNRTTDLEPWFITIRP